MNEAIPKGSVPKRPVKSSEQAKEKVGRVVMLERGPAIQFAVQAVKHVSTAQDCRVVVFCDGSSDAQGTEGAYAASVNTYLPGIEEHGQRVGYGWPMDVAVGSSSCEATGIFEGINKAEESICGIWKSKVLRPADRPESITVDVFSDCQGVLRALKVAKEDRKSSTRNDLKEASTTSTLTKQLIEEILDAEEALLRLRSKYKLKSLLVNYHWVPGHKGVLPHDQVDELCGKAREENKPVFAIDGVVCKMPGGYRSSYPSIRALFLRGQTLKKQVAGKHCKALEMISATVSAVRKTVKNVVNEASKAPNSVKDGINKPSKVTKEENGKRSQRLKEAMKRALNIKGHGSA